jgi:hypothetical protein
MHFDYQDRSSQNITHVLRNLLRQLLQNLELRRWPIGLFEAKASTHYHSLDVPTIIQYITHCIEQFSVTFFILDALDECEDATRWKLLNIINNARHHHHNIKIFVTSRLGPDSLESTDILTVTAEKLDLELFIRAKIAHKRYDQPLQDMIVSKLMDLSNEG